MKTFIVVIVNLFDAEIIIKKIEAETWQRAVQLHPEYPFKEIIEDGVNQFHQTPQDIFLEYNQKYQEFSEENEVLSEEEVFKNKCSNCECLIEWVEV